MAVTGLVDSASEFDMARLLCWGSWVAKQYWRCWGGLEWWKRLDEAVVLMGFETKLALEEQSLSGVTCTLSICLEVVVLGLQTALKLASVVKISASTTGYSLTSQRGLG